MELQIYRSVSVFQNCTFLIETVRTPVACSISLEVLNSVELKIQKIILEVLQLEMYERACGTELTTSTLNLLLSIANSSPQRNLV